MANVYAFKDAAHYVGDDSKALCGKTVKMSEAHRIGPRPQGVIFCGACVASAQAAAAQAAAPAAAPAPAPATTKKKK